MLFNSPTFVVFFFFVFCLYWLLRNRRAQNILLIGASYVFYGTWSWKFLLLLMFSTLFDYTCGRAIGATSEPRRRKVFLIASVVANLSLLGTFKYAGFFARQAADLLNSMGMSVHPWVLAIVLPVGLSFYTFQSLGYVIDVYRGKLPAVRSLEEFALYVAFFPQLVAGPIERATHMLPQYRRDRVFSASALESGLLLALWGLFKKVVIADNLAPYVNAVFRDPSAYSGAGLTTAVLFFAFQIYCDFSGYSDCARGVARTMGFELMVNFNLPYFSRTPVEFWQRWHISLSQWFQDYLYFPLAMRYMRQGGWGSKYKAHIISFVLIGFWHGANWTFVVFGLYWGVVIASYLFLQERMSELPEDSPWRGGAEGSFTASLYAVMTTLLTLAIAWFGWLMFRSDTLTQVGQITSRLFSASGLNDVVRADVMKSTWLWTMIAGLWIAEWVYWRFPAVLNALTGSPARRVFWRYGLVVCVLVAYLGSQNKALPFIYFQF